MQELVTPLVVLTREAPPAPTDRFVSISSMPPDWWHLHEESRALPERSATLEEVSRPEEPNTQLDLLAAPPEAPDALEPEAPEQRIVERLLESPRLEAMLSRGSSMVGREQVRAVLGTLRANGDSMPFDALARELNYNPARTGRLLTMVRDIVNLDAIQTLRHIRSERRVVLDVELLRRQFELPDDS
jgi:hypothetical protein